MRGRGRRHPDAPGRRAPQADAGVASRARWLSRPHHRRPAPHLPTPPRCSSRRWFAPYIGASRPPGSPSGWPASSLSYFLSPVALRRPRRRRLGQALRRPVRPPAFPARLANRRYSCHVVHRGADRPRPTSTTSRRSSPSRTPTSTRSTHAVADNADAIFTWDYDDGAPGAAQAVREGQDRRSGTARPTCRGTTEVDQEARGHRQRQAAHEAGVGTDLDYYIGSPVEKWGDEGVARVRHREPELDAEPVPARRAGRAAVHRQDRRDGAVDRRQVLRVDAGDGRGPPRRGVRAVPRREARRRTTRSTRTCGCCSTTSSTTAAGT